MWSLSSSTSSHIPVHAAPALMENCSNSWESNQSEGGERVNLQEHEENEEELIFLDIFHGLTFVFIFYGEKIFFIINLQTLREMYTERMSKHPVDGWMDTSRHTTYPHTYSHSSPVFFFIETCMPLHLLLPSLLTADVEVLFRTEGLYLVFQSNNFNVWVDTIDEEPWVLLHSIMYDSLLSKYVITALSYNNYVIFLDRSNWNLLCREVITAYFSSFVSEWVAFMGKKKLCMLKILYKMLGFQKVLDLLRCMGFLRDNSFSLFSAMQKCLFN